MSQLIEHRVRTLLQRVKKEKADGILVVNGGPVRYFSGFTGDSSILLITPRKRFFLTDSRYTEQARQTVKGYEIIDKGGIYGLAAEKAKELKIKKLIFEPHILTYQTVMDLEKSCGRKVRLVPVSNASEHIMRIKGPEELASIRKAAAIADAAYRYIIKRIKPGMTERQIGLDMNDFMVKHGAMGPSFGPIVAVDENAALPHYPTGDVKVKKDSAILIDWGALYNFYASDCTRMHYMSEPKGLQREIHEVCREAQARAFAKIKPGAYAREVDSAARDFIIDEGFGDFGHGLGHGIGMNVHEGPRLNRATTDILEPGMVFTVEPGIYIPGKAGVRLEDMVVITKTGYEIITGMPIQKFSRPVLGGLKKKRK